MIVKLLLSGSVLFAALAPQTKNSGGSSSMPAELPVKMGLWENTVTTSQGDNEKTQSCFTKESFQKSIANMPANCTVSNQVWTSHSYSSDIACNGSGSRSTGHLDMQFPDPQTARSTLKITMNAPGKTVPITITTESHFVSADCGDLLAGQSKIIQ